jgi:hypothetical protein
MVHLLPASEGHHHAYPGGLLRHGLETAEAALSISESRLFSNATDTPAVRHGHEPRWRIALLYGALSHDLGKLEDVRVFAGKDVWAPHQRILATWVQERARRGYELTWRSDRHGEHESNTLVYAVKLLPEYIRDWMLAPGSGPLKAVMGYLSGDKESVLGEVLTEGDRASVERDMKRSSGPVSAAGSGVVTEAVCAWLRGARTDGAHPELFTDDAYAWVPWTAASKGLVPAVTTAAGAPRNVESFHRLVKQAGLLADPPAGFGQPNPVPLWRILPEGANESDNALAFPWRTLNLAPLEHAKRAAPVGGLTSKSEHEVKTEAPTKAPKRKAPAVPAQSQDSGSEGTPKLADVFAQEHGRAPKAESERDAWRKEAGVVGEELCRLVEKARDALLPEGWIVARDQRLWLRWPEVWRAQDPAEALKTFQQCDWLEPNPDAPLRPNHMRDGVSWLVLKPALSSHLIPIMSPSEAAHTPKEPSSRASDKDKAPPSRARRAGTRQRSQSRGGSATPAVRELLEAHPDWREQGEITQVAIEALKKELRLSTWAVLDAIAEIDSERAD